MDEETETREVSTEEDTANRHSQMGSLLSASALSFLKWLLPA